MRDDSDYVVEDGHVAEKSEHNLRTTLLELCERWLKIEQDCERHLREDKLSPAGACSWLTQQQAIGCCRVELQAALKLPAQKGDGV